MKDGLGCTGQNQQPCMVLHLASDMDGFGDRADAIELQIGEIQIKFKGQRLAGRWMICFKSRSIVHLA